MSVELVPVLVAVVAIAALLLSGTPIAFSLMAGAIVGFVLLDGTDTATATLASLPFSSAANYNLVLVPMFMVMGLLANAGGILTAMFDLAERTLTRLPGGLAVAATISAGFLGGISGSSVADTASLGRITTEHMHKRGYDLGFAAAVVAASNTVAVLIPPSLALVLIGVVSEQPIGPLLLAGIVPGILTVVLYAACCIGMARWRPGIVFSAPARTREVTAPASRVAAGQARGSGATDNARAQEDSSHVVPAQSPGQQDWVVSVVGVLAGAVLMGLVLGGLYSGVFTANEAGFAGAAAALVLSVALILLRRRRMSEGSLRDLAPAFTEAARLTGVVFLLYIGATLFSNFLILAGVPSAITTMITDSPVPPVGIVVLFLLVTLLLGMFLDPIAILLIVAPITFPVVTALGYSEIWFAILFVKCIEIGLLTPPVGMNAFVVAAVHKDLTVERVFARLTPFIATEFVVLAALFLIPTISTWLPASQ